MRAILIFVLLVINGCGTNPGTVKNTPNELEKFAYANCLMWYLDSKGYDSSDVRAISGGIVEKSNISIDDFQKIALIIKDFAPNLQTKNNIDKRILKCFHLDKSEDLNELFKR